MKNFIDYYYNFNINNITFNNENYFFYNASSRYMLKYFENNELTFEQIKIIQQLNNYPYFFTPIPNKDNNYITRIENKPYILLKLSKIENHKISIFDIRTDIYVSVTNENLLLNHFPWIELWENKIDYYEKWFSIKYDNYKGIFPLFHYFIGIAENALLYLKESDKEEQKSNIDKFVIAHKRLIVDNTLYDYYDPTNIIIDHPSRDISEYLKSLFINKIWDLDVFREYLEKHKFSKYGIRIMLSRIMFPSFFFDYIEKMILDNSEVDLLYLETRAEEYQKFIKEITLFFKEKYNVNIISWIIKT